MPYRKNSEAIYVRDGITPMKPLTNRDMTDTDQNEGQQLMRDSSFIQ